MMMGSNFSRIIWVFTLFTQAGSRTAGAGVQFFALGDLPGGSVSSTGFGVANLGVAAVGRSSSANSGAGSEAFRWSAVGGMQGLGTLSVGPDGSEARAVSGDGRVVAGIAGSDNGQEAFRWTPEGGMEGLGDLPGGPFQSAGLGLSADGSTVVGNSWGSSPNGAEPFRWTRETGMHPLGHLPGGFDAGQATGVSGNGSVVVGYARRFDFAGEAFRWTEQTGMVGLGDLPGGGFQSYATAVSADGATIIGHSASSNGSEAFRWTAGGGMVGLGDLPGGRFESDALSVSGDGSMIVGKGFVPVPGAPLLTTPAAFLWTQQRGMLNLRDLLINEYGIDLTNWWLYDARGISPDGTAIIGTAINPAGNPEAYLVILPEPATIGLFGLAAAFLPRRRRKVKISA